jgi:O-antigen ligase
LPLWAKFALFTFIPLAIMVMLWTLTRSAYVALPVGIFTITFITRNRMLVIFTGILVVLYVILSVTGAGRGNVYIARFFTTTATEQDDSYQVRQAIFDRTVVAVYDSPFGSGPNTTGANGQKTLAASGGDLSDSQFAGTATDNYYLRMGLEAGWLGFLVFVLLAICTIISSLLCFYQAKSRSAKYLLIAIVAVILSMLVGSWANNYFQYPPLTQIFFMSLGLLGPLRDIKEEDLMPPKRQKIYY